MKLKQFQKGRTFLGSLSSKQDMLDGINEFCEKENIRTGIIKAIGTFTQAKIGFFNQVTKKYEIHEFNEELEITTAFGTISTLDGKPTAHVHVTLGRSDASVIGGHLFSPSIVFVGEIVIQELVGDELVREFDNDVGLSLWRI